MFTLKVIKEQVKNNESDFVLIFSRKIRVAAYFFCDLFITRGADGTGHKVKRVTCKFIHARAQGITVRLCQVVVDC
jgi:hypothetical protein